MNTDPRQGHVERDPKLNEHLRLQEEERHLAALARGRKVEMERIRDFRTAGMSRRRLIQIYGSDLVDMALAS